MRTVIEREGWRPAPRALSAEFLVVIGDVHGQDHLLGCLHEAVAADLEEVALLGVVSLCVHVGDLIDRGTGNLAAIDLARRGLQRAERNVVLRGNHEDMFLDAIKHSQALGNYEKCAWLENGGHLTMEEVGALDYDDLRLSIGEERISWLAGNPLMVRAGSYLICHAGVDPQRLLEEQQAQDLLWIRNRFLKHSRAMPDGVVVIHGHTPAEPGLAPAGNRINVDSGAFFSGRLTALEVHGEQMRLVHACGTPNARM